MAKCTVGYVKLGGDKSTPKIETCVATTTKDITVTVRGDSGETWPFKGYIRCKLRRASNASEVWIDVSTKNVGAWTSSSPKTITFSNIPYIGSVMEVTTEFYANSNYTGKYTSSAYHQFER